MPSALPPMAISAAARAKEQGLEAAAEAKARAKAAAEARAQRAAAAAAMPPPAVRASTAARTAAVAEAHAREAQAAASRRKSPTTGAGAGGAAAAAAVAGEQQQGQQQARRLTQHEMIAEAAMTEVANLADLDVLLAQEEEVKRKGHAAARAAYRGPRLRTLSRIVDGREQVRAFSLFFIFPSLSLSSIPILWLEMHKQTTLDSRS